MDRARSEVTVFGVLLAGALLSACAPNRTDPSWTGESRPSDVIHARQELMAHIEELMEPIDRLQVHDGGDLPRLHEAGEMIGAMLTALPHLFPPTTNLYRPTDVEPATLALPAVWTDFADFWQLAQASASAAERFASADASQLKAASAALRGSCDGCHALYLRRYEPPKVLPADLEFDFGKHLP